VKLGRQNNPVYATAGTWDSFGDALAGDSSRLFSYNGSRTNHMVSYNYAASGFYGELQYGMVKFQATTRLPAPTLTVAPQPCLLATRRARSMSC